MVLPSAQAAAVIREYRWLLWCEAVPDGWAVAPQSLCHHHYYSRLTYREVRDAG
jgi:hypothetical protein